MFLGNSATFSSAITAPRTVTMDSARSVGTLMFDSASAYTIAGASTLTLDAPPRGSTAITVASGSHTIAAPLMLVAETTITITPPAGALTLSNFATTTASLTKTGSGKLQVNRIRAAARTINAGAVRILPDQSSNGTSQLATLSIAPGASFDLAENKLVVTSTPTGTWTGSSYTGVTGMIATGQVFSSEQSGTYKMLGIAPAAQSGRAAGSVFSGVTLSSTDTLVMFTYGGDANLDSQINIDDYIKIDNGIANALTGWVNGDFNYDGKVNIDDYTTVIDANIGNQSGTFPTSSGAPASAGPLISTVPEPTLFPLLLLPILTRRRKKPAMSPPVAS
jgi:hypothetical protein